MPDPAAPKPAGTRKSPIPEQTTEIGRRIIFTIDLDLAQPDSLTYAASGLPRRAHFDPITRTFSWTPVDGQEGMWVLTFIATDPSGLSIAIPARIRVTSRVRQEEPLDAGALRRIIDINPARTGARARI